MDTSAFLKKPTTNLGCGSDQWGDIRIDVRKFFHITRTTSFLNVLASAEHIPLRDNSVSILKCSHVLEHLENPIQALREIARVADAFVISFPRDDGFKRHTIWAMLRLNVAEIAAGVRCRKTNEHKWIINPNVVKKVLEGQGFESIVQPEVRTSPIWLGLTLGRKGRFLRFALNRMQFSFNYGWQVKGRRVSSLHVRVPDGGQT